MFKRVNRILPKYTNNICLYIIKKVNWHRKRYIGIPFGLVPFNRSKLGPQSAAFKVTWYFLFLTHFSTYFNKASTDDVMIQDLIIKQYTQNEVNEQNKY